MSTHKSNVPVVKVQPITPEELRRRASTSSLAAALNPTANPQPSQAGGLAGLLGTPAPAQRSIQAGSFGMAAALSGPANPGSTGGVVVSSTADLGRLVRTARERMGLNQQQFSDLAGVGRRFLSELENGKSTSEFGLVLRVCKAAGIDVVAKSRQI